MKNEKMKRVAALALAGTMIASTVSPAAFAADGEEKSAPGTETIETEDASTSPSSSDASAGNSGSNGTDTSGGNGSGGSTTDTTTDSTPVSEPAAVEEAVTAGPVIENKDEQDNVVSTTTPVVVEPVIPDEVEGELTVQPDSDDDGEPEVVDESGNSVGNEGVLGVTEETDQEDPDKTDITIGDYPSTEGTDGEGKPGTITSTEEVDFGTAPDEGEEPTDADNTEKEELETELKKEPSNLEQIGSSDDKTGSLTLGEEGNEINYTVTAENPSTPVTRTDSDGNATSTVTQNFHLTTTSTNNEAELTDEEIAKILNAGLNLEDGVTLSPAGTDTAGNIVLKDTAGNTYTVNKNEGDATTTTTWTVQMTKVTTTYKDSGTIQDNELQIEDVPDSIGDKSVNTVLGWAVEASDPNSGVTTVKDSNGNITQVVKDGVTYDITYTYESVLESVDLSNLTTEQIYKLLDPENYTLSEDKRTILDADGHELVFDSTQNILQKVDISMTKTDPKGDVDTTKEIPESTTAASEADSEAKAAAELDAAQKALQAALTQQEVEGTVTVNEAGQLVYTPNDGGDSITINKPTDGSAWKVTIEGKEYSFDVTADDQTTSSTGAWTDLEDNENYSQQATVTVTGTATISGGKITWTGNGSQSASGTIGSNGNLGAGETPILNSDGTPVIQGEEGSQTFNGEKVISNENGVITTETVTTANGKTVTTTKKYSFTTLDETPGKDDVTAQLPDNAEITETNLKKIQWTVETTVTTTQDNVQIGETVTEGKVKEGQDGTYIYTNASNQEVTLVKDGDKYYAQMDDSLDKTSSFEIITLEDMTDPTQIETYLKALGYTNVSVDSSTLVATYTKQGESEATTTDYKALYNKNLKAALEQEGYSEVTINADGTATGKMNGETVTITNIDSTAKSISAVKETSYTLAKTDESELLEEIEAMFDGLGEDEYIEYDGKIITEYDKGQWEIWIEEGKAINFDAMDPEDLKELLIQYKTDADKADKSQSNINHVDLDVSSTLTIEGQEDPVNCVVLSQDLKLQYYQPVTSGQYGSSLSQSQIKENIEAAAQAAVDGNTNSTKQYETGTITLSNKITYDSAGHYEYTHAGNDHPDESSFYKVTGYVAYDRLTKDDLAGSYQWYDFSSLNEWQVGQLKQDANWNNEWEVVQLGNSYQIYTAKADLLAYGYMDYDSNNCRQKDNKKPGYDLMLGNLTLLESGKVVASGQGATSYSATLAIKQNSSGSRLTLNTISTKTETTPTSVTGNVVTGTYKVTYQENIVDSSGNDFKGTGNASYTVYRGWEQTVQTNYGTATGGQYTGSLTYSYDVESAPTVSVLSKTMETVRDVYAELTKTPAPTGGNGGNGGDNEEDPELPPEEDDELVLILTDVPTEEEAEITEADTPLAPAETEEAEIEEEETPLTAAPETGDSTAEIGDDDVAKAAVPKTGDESGIFLLMSALSGMALAAMSFIDRKGRHARFGSQH